MATNTVEELATLGQAVWLDSIQRSQILNGGLKKLVNEDGLTGETANPSLFEKAIVESDDYDIAIRKMAQAGKNTNEIYESLAFQDVEMALDIFRGVYDRTNGADGFVSIEVSPRLARDTQGSIAEALRFFSEIKRPNVMIKIPGTPEGVPAIEECLYQGININITLLFSVDAYEQVAWAYIRTLERRVAEGKPIDHLASVASFFVSRIDTLADQMIDARIKSTADMTLASRLGSLKGKIAIANAKVAYQRFKMIFSSARFNALRERGALVQRPLWASTSTKNPSYRDVMYVEELIGHDTVNTMPMETLRAFQDHGAARLTIEENLAEARQTLQELDQVGLRLDAITNQLVDEGVQKFDHSFDQLLQGIVSKRGEHGLGSTKPDARHLGRYSVYKRPLAASKPVPQPRSSSHSFATYARRSSARKS